MCVFHIYVRCLKYIYVSYNIFLYIDTQNSKNNVCKEGNFPTSPGKWAFFYLGIHVCVQLDTYDDVCVLQGNFVIIFYLITDSFLLHPSSIAV